MGMCQLLFLLLLLLIGLGIGARFFRRFFRLLLLLLLLFVLLLLLLLLQLLHVELVLVSERRQRSVGVAAQSGHRRVVVLPLPGPDVCRWQTERRTRVKNQFSRNAGVRSVLNHGTNNFDTRTELYFVFIENE